MSLRTTKGGVVEEEVLVDEVVLLVGLLPPPRGSAGWLRLRSLAVSVDGAVQDRARSPCAAATGGSEMAVTRASPRTMRRRRDWRVAPLGRVPRANCSARKPAPARGWVASGRPSRPTQSAGPRGQGRGASPPRVWLRRSAAPPARAQARGVFRGVVNSLRPGVAVPRGAQSVFLC